MKESTKIPSSNTALELARELVMNPCIPDLPEDQYEIYEHVPGSAILQNEKPLIVPIYNIFPKAEIVICKGGKICLAVVSPQNENWFHMCTPGLSLVVSSGTQNIQGILTCLETAEDLLESAEYTYSVDALMLMQTSCKNLPGQEITLSTISSLEDDRDLNIFVRLDKNEDCTITAVSVASRKSLYRVLTKLVWKNDSMQDPSLSKRMERLDRKIPSDPQYSTLITDYLKALKDLPLTQYFKTCPQHLQTLDHLLQSACALCQGKCSHPFQGKEEILTFQDTVEVIAFLESQYAPYDPDAERFRSLCVEMLIILCQPVIDPNTYAIQGDTEQKLSLNNRLGTEKGCSAWNFQVFKLPLSQYFYGMCQLNRSGYGDWVYHRILYPFLDVRQYDEMDYTPASMMRYALQKTVDQSYSVNMFPILYNILVSPFTEN